MASEIRRLDQKTIPRPLWPFMVSWWGQSSNALHVLAPDKEAAEHITRFYEAAFPERRAVFVPGWDVSLYDSVAPHPSILARRFLAAQAIHEQSYDLLVLDVVSLFQPLSKWDGDPLCILEEGIELDERLLDNFGYRRVSEVSAPGEYAQRGATLDVWSAIEPHPVRVDRFDVLVEELRRFDPVSQLGAKVLTQYQLAACALHVLDVETLTQKIENRARRSYAHPDQVQLLLEALQTGKHLAGVHAWMATQYETVPFPSRYDVLVAPEQIDQTLQTQWNNQRTISEEMVQQGMPIPGAGSMRQEDRDALSNTLASGTADYLNAVAIVNKERSEKAVKRLIETANPNGQVWVTCRPSELQTVQKIVQTLGIEDRPRIVPTRVQGHWDLDGLKIRLIDMSQILRRTSLRANPIQARGFDLGDIKEGDYVVHIDYGVGRFSGLENVQLEGQRFEVVRLIYRDDNTLLLPVTRLNLIEPYRGDGEHAPQLDQLGTQHWAKKKQRVREDLLQFAGHLLRVFAQREQAKRSPLSMAGELTASVEATFPYEETAGQLEAIANIREDLEQDQPMDRLLVGDVGYGKTEVALRTAIRFVENGFQVALLAPTTVLAAQHGRTIHNRVRDLPIRTAVLSRFTSTNEKKQILEELRAGRVDIVVGTHRLLQPDVVFKQLGLVIVDEEHRFGVKHKEALKALRADVDTLAMSATPIPRTLQLHIGGLREISMIATPPANRLAVQTNAQPMDKGMLKEALLREIRRGGQAFVLRNRIAALPETAQMLLELIPELRTGTAHGKMTATEIEKVFDDFLHRRIDVLLATSIIESGLDFPNANTLIVLDAQNYGLADLYQLRGRVGRSDRRAYAYLFYPQDLELSANARERLEALESFSALGSGFQIAMRDLEIRGAGEFLGKKQSGHIRGVGLGMTMQMLRDAIQEQQGQSWDEGFEPEIQTTFSLRLSDEWIESTQERLRCYQKIALSDSYQDILNIIRQYEDQYGPSQEEDQFYGHVMGLKSLLRLLRIRRLHLSENTAQLFFEQDTPVPLPALIAWVEGQEQWQLQPDRLTCTETSLGQQAGIVWFRTALEAIALLIKE